MPPSFDTLDLQVAQHIATLSLNRPDKANAMNATMWDELQRCFEWLDAEPAVRVVILAGSGSHFCAGIDLNMFAAVHGTAEEPARRAEFFRRTILRLQDNLSAIEKCRKPVLAAIHHSCIGGGVDMICCADMRYATRDAFFSIREIDIGMTADVGTLQRLPKLIPDGVARELAYTGRNVEANEAAAIGLVNRVFATPEELTAGVMKLAQAIAAKSPLAIRGTKEMLNYGRDHSVADGLNYVATWNAAMLMSADLSEAMAAAREKRPPMFED